MRIVSIILVLFHFVQFALAQNPILLVGQPDWNTDINISASTYQWKDLSEDQSTAGELKTPLFQPFNFLSSRYSEKPGIVQWLQFYVSNSNKKDTINLVLNLGAHYLMKLYKGDSLVSKRGISVAYRGSDRFGLPLSILPGTKVLYRVKVFERIRYLSPLVPYLGTPYTRNLGLNESFHQERWLRFAMPLMSGILFLVALFGFYQFQLLKDKTFLYYATYAFFAWLYTLFWIEDRLNLMLFNDSAKMVLDSFTYVPVLTGYSLFISRIINISKRYPKVWNGLKFLLCVVALQSIITYTEYRTDTFLFKTNFYYSYLMGIPGLLITSILLILSIVSQSAVKRFVVAGLTSLMVFHFLPLGIGFGNFYDLPYELTSIIHYGPFFLTIGLTLEAVCFTFALAYRTKMLSHENARMQLQYTTRLEEELHVRSLKLQEQNKIMEDQKIKQLETEFEQKLAETEMTALRAQMNPHFIFNCLNSIKLYTLENDSKTASAYLTIFSQLIRLVLENSQSEKITLHRELETLRLYIELEAMRFKNKIKYKIAVSDEVDQHYIEIPPLLLQPFVENAIWHGLMHKKEGGEIVIGISLTSEHLLEIIITDNGVGREVARQYKSKSATKQKSFGIKMTTERINNIRHNAISNRSVKIIDLKDNFNNPAGTKVIITLPV
jgi:anti-sigma regulatory factor (Ser/Thr protein kinase)